MPPSPSPKGQELQSEPEPPNTSSNTTTISASNEDRDGVDNSSPQPAAKAAVVAQSPLKKGARFWAIMVTLSMTGVLTALDNTITSTALPTIIADIGGGDQYVWAINAYLLTQTALQPLYGQLSNVFGRRWPTIIATALFVLGSGICGGARNMATLIAGRVVQGLGGAGLMLLVEIIICDLVPLRERGTYLAILFGIVSVGTGLGPFFGGLIVDNTTWRWVFYVNLPIGGVAVVMLFLWLNVNYKKEEVLATRMASIDWIGNVLFILAVSSMLIGLAWAGAVYPWSSYQVLVPLLVGAAGFAGFVIIEAFPKIAPVPTMPLRLWSNRTSAIVLAITFLHGLVTFWAMYFLPIYFQGVLGSSPSYSGLQLLVTILFLLPGAISGGALLSKFGKYKPIHFTGLALMVVGLGLFTLLDENSSRGEWVGLQIVQGVGAGVVIPALLPALMAPLAESDVAVAASTWSFVRNFGMVWGTAIPASILNNRLAQLAPGVEDPGVRAELSSGRAYEHATKAYLETLSSSARAEFVRAMNLGIRRSWQVAIAFIGLAFLLVVFEKSVPLREELDTEFGIREDKAQSAEKVAEVGGVVKVSQEATETKA